MKPLPPSSPVQLTEAEYKIFKLGWLECEAAQANEAPKQLKRLSVEDIARLWRDAINSIDDLGPISVFANSIMDELIKKSTGASGD